MSVAAVLLQWAKVLVLALGLVLVLASVGPVGFEA
jgi:hypothetical protein